MTILSTLVTMFTADTVQLEEGSKKADKIVKHTQDNLNKTDIAAKRLGESFVQLTTQAIGFFTTALGVSAIIAGVKSAADYSNELNGLSKTLHVSTEALDAWGSAVKKNGGTSEGLHSSIEAINKSIAGTKREGAGAIPQLLRIASMFEKLSKSDSQTLGKKLGLDEGTILFLQRGRKEVESIIAKQKELGLVTKQDAEIAAKFNMQWNDTTHAFRSLFTTVGSWVLPALSLVAKGFENTAVFFRKNKDFLIGTLIAIGAAISYFIVPALIKASIAAAPFILIGVAIAAVAAAFALLYDDIRAFYRGADSVLGLMIQKWPIVGKILKGIEWIIKGIWELLKGVGSAIAWIWENLVSDIKAVISFVQMVIDKIVAAYNKVKSFLGLGDTDVNANLRVAQDQLGAASANPLNSQTSNSIINNRKTASFRNFQTGPITINTQATDAQGIASSFGSSMEDQMRQAQNNFDDGVLA